MPPTALIRVLENILLGGPPPEKHETILTIDERPECRDWAAFSCPQWIRLNANLAKITFGPNNGHLPHDKTKS